MGKAHQRATLSAAQKTQPSQKVLTRQDQRTFARWTPPCREDALT